MPNMDGLAFVRTLRCDCPEIPIIVTSGRMDEKEREECRLLGVHVHLPKPFTEAQLASALKNVLMMDQSLASDDGGSKLPPPPGGRARGARSQTSA